VSFFEVLKIIVYGLYGYRLRFLFKCVMINPNFIIITKHRMKSILLKHFQIVD